MNDHAPETDPTRRRRLPLEPRKGFGPSGQRVMPFVAAQRGLDGLDYAPAPQAPPLGGEADQPSLGPSHGVLHGVSQTALLPAWSQTASDVQQLEMWDRLREAASILRWTEHDRQSKCLHTRIVPPGAPVVISRGANGRTRVVGVVRCGHMTCPACGVGRAREAAARLGAVFDAHLAPLPRSTGTPVPGVDFWDTDRMSQHDVWMLTPTVPHYASSSVEDVVRVLYDAWAAFKRSRAWRRFAKRWDIRATVRVLDVTFSRRSNGPHPHFHVALFPRRARVKSLWFDAERSASFWRAVEPDATDAEIAAHVDEGSWVPMRSLDAHSRAECMRELRVGLVPAWERAVLEAGGTIRNLGAFRDVGLELTPGEKSSSYFTAWGFFDEVAGTALKRETHLALLDRAAAGDEHARDMYLLWRRAVEGRAWVTGMADAMASVGVTDDDVAAWAERREDERVLAETDAGRPPVFVAELRVEIPSYLWFEALAVGLKTISAVVERADNEAEARAEVLALLMSSVSTRRHGASSASSIPPGRAALAPS